MLSERALHTSVLLAEKYPGFLDAAMPLACSVVEIGGRNRIFRKVLIDAICNDSGYQNGEYKQQPAALRTALGLILYDVSSSRRMQMLDPTRERADAELKSFIDSRIANLDANDLLYAFDASRDYDPSGKLDQIKAAVMWVNSADDVVNSPELGIAKEQIKKVKRGQGVRTDDEPGQEDFGWYLNFESSGISHCLVLLYRPDDVRDGATWIGRLERSRGLIGTILGRRKHGIQESAAEAIHRILQSSSLIRDVRWYFHEDFNRGDGHGAPSPSAPVST